MSTQLSPILESQRTRTPAGLMVDRPVCDTRGLRAQNPSELFAALLYSGPYPLRPPLEVGALPGRRRNLNPGDVLENPPHLLEDLPGALDGVAGMLTKER